ncbi:hypothetical protein KR018_010724 [Drosophila ironensis]|nr:hypothetical protein KR018_010724 [Drosophila ironensis]
MSESVAENAAAAENEELEDDSMEKLQLEEEDEKNVSGEDLLGGRSLMMSDDSENEDMTETKAKKSRKSRKLDSEDEEETEAKHSEENKEEQEEENKHLEAEEKEEEDVAPKPKKKISAIIDTDSEEEEKPQQEPPKKAKKPKKKQRLDSDEESEKEAQNSPEKPKKGKKRKQRLNSSDSEQETGKDDSAGESSPAKNKLKGLVDSESEPELSNAEESAKEEETIAEETTDKPKKAKAMREEDVAPKPKKKISAIIDTDSEEEEKPQQEPPKKAKKPKKKQRLDSDEESEKEAQNSPEKPKKGKKRKQRLNSSDSEQETGKDDSAGASSPAKNKLKGLVDSESETELSNAEESAKEEETIAEETTDKPKKAKAMRASAKKALDGMQAIQSEQQRLHREAHINVPYHQPKPRTLKEFLSRRTINTPLATALAGGSPMPNRQPRKSLALRMTSEELEAYAKLMDARAKEATEFFKPESDSEEEAEDEGENEPEEKHNELESEEQAKDNPGDIEEAMDVTDTLEDPQEQPEEDIPLAEEPIASTSAAAALKFSENMETPAERPAKSPTKVCLVTEVVELPKLDLSTINITPSSKPATPKISEAIRRLKIEKSTDVSPSLKGDANMVIDLETGDMFAKKPTGVDDLLQRLIKTREAKKHKSTETVNILTTEHGKLEMSKVSYHHHEEEPVSKEPKPGAGYIKMQEHLKSLITKKRMEELRKKKAQEEERMAEDEEEMDFDEEYEPEDKPGHAEVTINEDEEIVDGAAEDNEEEEDEDQEEDVEVDEKQSDAEDAEEGESSESEPEPEAETQAGKKKNRIIKAFADDNSDDDDLDLLQTPKPSGVAPLTATQLQLSASKLYDEEARKTASDEENELIDLCSGQFPESQMVSSAAPSSVISQIPMTQFKGNNDASDELEGLCSGTFATQLPEQTQREETPVESQSLPPVANKIMSSDEEDKANKGQAEAEKPRTKKLTKKRQKKKAKLGFSDDEESDNEGEPDEYDEEEEPEEEIPETFVDYDSEENEVVVEMTKKDRKLRAANFVDKEAELSESEWGSADEDEKNMDVYDIELGDEDQFDREKLRHELGQIHARKMLDQDIRDVRKIKEMLIEDDEGAVRQRQFRWRNAENGFSLDDQRPENGEANEGSGDEENEHLWRKIRYEREQLLLEKGLKEEAASPLSASVMNTSNPGSTIRRLNIITAKKTTVEVKKSSPFLISKAPVTGKLQKGNVRGSFLVRDQETLSKLAGLTKGSSVDADGAAGSASVKTTKAKNFVFATLTEEEHENQKRKASDLMNSSSETGVNFMKKPRLEPRREKCLIDQLL